MKLLWLQSALLLFPVTQVVAKRIPPKPVSPVVFEGIRYGADGDGEDEYVVAADATGGRGCGG